LAEDPLGFTAGDVNVFRYAGNGPPDASDPSGLGDPNWLEKVAYGWWETKKMEIRMVGAVTEKIADTMILEEKVFNGNKDKEAVTLIAGGLKTVAAAADVTATAMEGKGQKAFDKAMGFGAGYASDTIFVALPSTGERLLSEAAGTPEAAGAMQYTQFRNKARRIAIAADPVNAERGSVAAPFIDAVVITAVTEGTLRIVPVMPRVSVVSEVGLEPMQFSRLAGQRTINLAPITSETPVLAIEYGPVRPLVSYPKVVGLGDLTEYEGGKILAKGRLIPPQEAGSAGSTTIPKEIWKGVDPKQGYASFGDFKAAFGDAGPGEAWHHIVEQTVNSDRFAPELLHNPSNVIKLPHGQDSIHARVSGYYGSKQPFTGGLTVRAWISKKTFEEQFEFGVRVIKELGGTEYLPMSLR
jgi:hypothetical protein